MTRGFTGKLFYSTDYGPRRLLVAIQCLIGGELNPTYALWDTGSEWCVLPGLLASRHGGPPVGAEMRTLPSRLGSFEGWIDRIPVSLQPASGTPLEIDATWFVCPDWPGPAVLGWKGCMERMRFATDPSQDALYFAEL